MSFRTKERLIYGGLLLFTLWPMVHIALVKTHDLSSWKLAGWGMYATPRESYHGLEIYGRPAGSERFEQLTEASPELQQAVDRFLERYRWLRRLAQPDDVVRLARASHPEWETVRVVAYRTDLDRETSRVVMREYAYDYDD